MSKIDEGWIEIFNKMPVLNGVQRRGFFDITANDIKRITHQEARLMTKIDFREQLPKVMKDEKLAILAINNGTYRIGKFDPFISISQDTHSTIISKSYSSSIISLDPQKLGSESAVLDAAMLAGILDDSFGEESQLTIRGRMRYPDFNFALSGYNIPVSGVQIEIDGGYEGEKTINLVEAKIGSRCNLNIRQLIYPQVAWERKIQGQKSVKSFICFYQEPKIRIIPILFDAQGCRADHLNEKAYILLPEAKFDLMAIKPNANANLPVLGAPFPQADRIETALTMFNIIIAKDSVSKTDLQADFDIVPRQIDYYTNILRWLGLIEDVVRVETLEPTTLGLQIGALPHAEKIKRIAEIIFTEPIFNHVLHHGCENVPEPLFTRWKIAGTTPKRRLSTVNAWVKYFKQFAQQDILKI